MPVIEIAATLEVTTPTFSAGIPPAATAAGLAGAVTVTAVDGVADVAAAVAAGAASVFIGGAKPATVVLPPASSTEGVPFALWSATDLSVGVSWQAGEVADAVRLVGTVDLDGAFGWWMTPVGIGAVSWLGHPVTPGGGGGVDLSDTTPSALGTAAAGTGTAASRDDHVHAMPSAADVGADPAGTAAGLVDDLSGVTNAATARSNLGLGGAAVLAVGTTAGTVAAGNDARLSDARTPTAHNHAASEVTSGTLDIARIPTGTTSTTVPLGNDSRFGPVPGQGLYVAGSLYGTPCATGGSRTVANGSLYFFPIIIDGTTATADALCINVLTGVGSSTVHLYLVSSSATTGRPTAASTVLAKASNVSTASSSTRVVAAFDSSATASLTRGTYWGAIHSIAGTPTLRAAASAFQFGPPLVQHPLDTANGITLISATGGGTSTTALTSLAGLSFNAADLNQAPIVFWRAA